MNQRAHKKRGPRFGAGNLNMMVSVMTWSTFHYEPTSATKESKLCAGLNLHSLAHACPVSIEIYTLEKF